MAKAASLEAFKENNEAKAIDTSKRIRIGIIGTGWIAESHLSSLLKQPDIDVVAGADLIPCQSAGFADGATHQHEYFHIFATFGAFDLCQPGRALALLTSVDQHSITPSDSPHPQTAGKPPDLLHCACKRPHPPEPQQKPCRFPAE